MLEEGHVPYVHPLIERNRTPRLMFAVLKDKRRRSCTLYSVIFEIAYMSVLCCRTTQAGILVYFMFALG